MFLRYIASQSFMIVAGDLLGLSKSSAHRAIHAVMDEIVKLHDLYIKFPDDLAPLETKFRQKSGLPGFVGAIDCTQIKIQNPCRQNGEIFRNRKGFFSINVQAVCDTDLRFMDVVCQWPGSVHDSRIFANSRLKLSLDSGLIRGRLLGDAGYPLLPYLIVPYPTQNSTPQQRRFNHAHSRARMAIEKSFGVLKRRFPGLKNEIRLTDPTEICKLIHSSFILHNMCILHNDEDDFDDIADVEEGLVDDRAHADEQVHQAHQIRDELCRLLQ